MAQAVGRLLKIHSLVNEEFPYTHESCDALYSRPTRWLRHTL